jgi:hypothetical protein
MIFYKAFIIIRNPSPLPPLRIEPTTGLGANQGTLGSFFQGFRKDMITQGPNIVLKTVFDIDCVL